MLEYMARESESLVFEIVSSSKEIFLSTMGFKSCGNLGLPRSKTKYRNAPIVNKYREGKVKSTPEGE